MGLLPRVELRVLWGGAANYTQTRTYYGPFGEHYQLTGHGSGSSSLEVGFKFQVSEQRRWIPQSALVTDMIVPTGDYWGAPFHVQAVHASRDASGLLDYIYFCALASASLWAAAPEPCSDRTTA